MRWYKSTIDIPTKGKGLYPFTNTVNELIHQYGVQEGICYLFIQHTSASLVVSESYDPTARTDMESFFDRLVPENQPWHRHTLEGPNDSPSHMRAILTNVNLIVPFDHGQLCLGTWQGIYLFEHRSLGHNRKVLLRFLELT
jgi:secondary thiamine-phosphate synthase enzyme